MAREEYSLPRSGDVDKIYDIHNTRWEGAELRLSDSQVSHLYDDGLIRVMRVNGTVTGVLFIHRMFTGGAVPDPYQFRLWERLVHATAPGIAPDTIIMWSIDVPAGSPKGLGTRLIAAAKEEFRATPYLATFSPVKGYKSFCQEIISRGAIPKRRVEESGIYLFLATSMKRGYEAYLRYLQDVPDTHFMMPEDWYRGRGWGSLCPVNRFHAVRNGASLVGVWPAGPGARPCSPFTVMYSYKGFETTVAESFRKLPDQVLGRRAVFNLV
ncbi:MAG: hypothetical protein ABII02_02960 [Candidatus Magasanikbacteria bacterium]